jgi:hypothetical protein
MECHSLFKVSHEAKFYVVEVKALEAYSTYLGLSMDHFRLDLDTHSQNSNQTETYSRV